MPVLIESGFNKTQAGSTISGAATNTIRLLEKHMHTRKVSISDLKPHPRQQDVFGDLNNAEYESLKSDIETNGLRQPPEVTADLTLIDGHQRVRAYQELGRTEIEVIVRDDLDEVGVDEAFITANLLRRNLDIVARARAYKVCYEIQKGRQYCRDDNPVFREFIAKQLRISGRTLDRHLKLLHLPREIQDAVSAKELGLTKAIKACSLPKEEYNDLKERIASGENAAKVVNEFIPKPQKKTKSPEELFEDLVDFLSENLDKFEADQVELTERIAHSERMISVIDRSCDLLVQLNDTAELLKNAQPKRSGKATKAIQRPR